MGNVWNHNYEHTRQVEGKMGIAQSVLQPLIMKHLQGPGDDGYCVLECESAGVDFFS